jgi:hypothetical protein
LNRGFPSLAWHPDSRHLIYAINSIRDGQSAVSLWRVAVDDGQPQSLGPPLEGFSLHSLSAHPNGQQVALIGEYWDEPPAVGAEEDPIDAAEEMWVLEDFLPSRRDVDLGQAPYGFTRCDPYSSRPILIDHAIGVDAPPVP